MTNEEKNRIYRERAQQYYDAGYSQQQAIALAKADVDKLVAQEEADSVPSPEEQVAINLGTATAGAGTAAIAEKGGEALYTSLFPEVAEAVTEEVALQGAGDLAASEVGAGAAAEAGAGVGTAAASEAVPVGSAVMADGSAGVLMSDGSVVAAEGTGTGLSAGTMGTIGGIGAAVMGAIKTAEATKGMHEKLGRDITRSEFEEDASSPTQHLGIGGTVGSMGKTLENAYYKVDPLASRVLTPIFNAIMGGKTQVEGERLQGLARAFYDQGIDPTIISPNFDINSPHLGFEDEKRGRSQQLADLENQTGSGFDESGNWYNADWLGSNGDESLFKPEDTWGYGAWGENFGPGYYTATEDQRRQANQYAIDNSLVNEHNGTIDLNLDDERRKEINRMLGIPEPEAA